MPPRYEPTGGADSVEYLPGARGVAGRVLAAGGAGVCAVGVWAVWRFFVRTRLGQQIDQAAFEGAGIGRTRLWHLAEPVLDTISIPVIAVVLGVSVVVALIHRRWHLAAQVAVLVAGANVTTQLLKLAVLHRADLGIGFGERNTLPSGHTAAAASCGVALVLVAPRRYRAVVAVGAAVYTAGTGVSTLIGAWHRPADVVAGALAVLGWTCVARAIVAAGPPSLPPDRHREMSAIVVLVGCGVVALAGAAAVMHRTEAAVGHVVGFWPFTGELSRMELLTAYGGGALGIVGAVSVVFGAVLLLLRLTENGSPAAQ